MESKYEEKTTVVVELELRCIRKSLGSSAVRLICCSVVWSCGRLEDSVVQSSSRFLARSFGRVVGWRLRRSASLSVSGLVVRSFVVYEEYYTTRGTVSLVTVIMPTLFIRHTRSASDTPYGGMLTQI